MHNAFKCWWTTSQFFSARSFGISKLERLVTVLTIFKEIFLNVIFQCHMALILATSNSLTTLFLSNEACRGCAPFITPIDENKNV